MPTQIVVPELGESVVEATVARWLKQAGDHVDVGEAILELETEKVDLEVGAEQTGVLTEIKVPAGEDVEVGDVLGIIEPVEVAEGAEAAEASQAEAEEPEEPRQAEAAQGDVPEAPEPEEVEGREPAGVRGDGATPVARRYAEEQSIDVTEVPGTGPRGRVTREDVERYVRQHEMEAPPDAAAEPGQEWAEAGVRERAPAPAPAQAPSDRGEERVRMSRRRRTIARRLVEAQETAAMLTTFNDVDMSAVMELRARRKEAFQERHGVKLGITSFFVKAAIGALKAYPELNAEIDGDDIVYKHFYDIGVAIGAKQGLVVPVLRNADRMSFADIERAIKDFAERAETGDLSLEDLRGGTFSITNGGIFGSLLSTPILNPPQVGILGLHRIEERPVVEAGEVVVRPMMYLALTYDHRIVDGREAVQFLGRVKELIEDPETLLLEG
jgi:2-oxoglutarate dehydrogenase E2 component (dihydrolipoamide succinyltransferase)